MHAEPTYLFLMKETRMRGKRCTIVFSGRWWRLRFSLLSPRQIHTHLVAALQLERSREAVLKEINRLVRINCRSPGPADKKVTVTNYVVVRLRTCIETFSLAGPGSQILP